MTCFQLRRSCGQASYKELHSFAEPQCLSFDKDKDNYCMNKPEKSSLFIGSFMESYK